MSELDLIATEQINPRTTHIDEGSTIDILTLINQEDQLVAEAVAQELSHIAEAVDVIYQQMKKGGRLIYLGCGTSGRLGILDAVECPPTYGTSPDLVVGLMAGGMAAFQVAVEGAEDNYEMGKTDLQEIGFAQRDVLVGVAASGRTPYVLGGMDYARSLGAPVIALTSNPTGLLVQHADIAITPRTGAEVVTGSTRMKSGTAQKMVLNMLSTAVMIKMGKVYGNLMVDVKATNEKLSLRANAIVTSATGVSQAEAAEALSQCGQSCKKAIVMLLLSCTPQKATAYLEKANGHIRRAIALSKEE